MLWSIKCVNLPTSCFHLFTLWNIHIHTRVRVKLVLMRSNKWGFMMIIGSESQRAWHSWLHCTRQRNHCRSLLLQPIKRTVLCLATFALYKLSNTCYFLIHNCMRTNGKWANKSSQISTVSMFICYAWRLQLCFEIHLETAWRWHFPARRATPASPTPNMLSSQIYFEV